MLTFEKKRKKSAFGGIWLYDIYIDGKYVDTIIKHPNNLTEKELNKLRGLK